MCVLAEINRNKKKKPTPFVSDDFMPKRKEKPKKEPSAKAQMLFLKLTMEPGIHN